MQNKISNRNKKITPYLVGQTMLIYNGKSYHEIKILSKMVGFKLGEFSLTRKKPSHKKT